MVYNSPAKASSEQNEFSSTNSSSTSNSRPPHVSHQSIAVSLESCTFPSEASNFSLIHWNNMQQSNMLIDPICDRRILRAHKMGVSIIQQFFPTIRTSIIHPDRLREAIKKSQDYRHVVITRPWYDAIISGYLYHKSGRECWLDMYGRIRKTNKTMDWEGGLKMQPLDPPARGRSLCSYLSEESEIVGLKAFIDVSVHQWYAGIIPHKELVMQVEASDTSNNRSQKTLFICFDDLDSADTLPFVHRQVMEFLYPNRPYQETNLNNDKRVHSGHSTSRDSGLRERLRSLVSEIDHQYFEAIGERATRLFRCEKNIRKDGTVRSRLSTNS